MSGTSTSLSYSPQPLASLNTPGFRQIRTRFYAKTIIDCYDSQQLKRTCAVGSFQLYFGNLPEGICRKRMTESGL
jgi:hypothetical protein